MPNSSLQNREENNEKGSEDRGGTYHSQWMVQVQGKSSFGFPNFGGSPLNRRTLDFEDLKIFRLAKSWISKATTGFYRRFEFESSTIFNMIIRDRIVRATSRECSRILRNHGIRHVRFASVSPQFLQSRPAGPPRTDYLQKYQDKLERKAKE